MAPGARVQQPSIPLVGEIKLTITTRTTTHTRRRRHDAAVVLTDQEKRILCHLLNGACDHPHIFGADHRDIGSQAANFFREAARLLIRKLGGKAPPPVRNETLVHYMVVYSRPLERTIIERACDDWADATRQRALAEANPTWSDRDTFEVRCFRGSSREELVATQPRYFQPRLN